MLLRPATRAVLRAARAVSSSWQWNISSTSASVDNWSSGRCLRLGLIATSRELSTSTTHNSESQSRRFQQEGDEARVNELLEMIEQSREEQDVERELKQSSELYEVLMKRNQQDTELFEVAFGIARIYDEQMEDGSSAIKYYQEALSILEAISTEVTAWGAYMRVTTLGALAVCHDNFGQPEEAEKYFDDAIGAYEEHCDRASTAEEDVSDTEVSLLADLNATAAMIHYHYAGSLLAQERSEEAKNVTEIALVLAENSSMPAEDLEELQHCIHELWMEMD